MPKDYLGRLNTLFRQSMSASNEARKARMRGDKAGAKAAQKAKSKISDQYNKARDEFKGTRGKK